MINVGAKIRLFDGELVKNKEVSVEYLMNRFDRYKDIQKQNEMLDDLMYGEGIWSPFLRGIFFYIPSGGRCLRMCKSEIKLPDNRINPDFWLI